MKRIVTFFMIVCCILSAAGCNKKQAAGKMADFKVQDKKITDKKTFTENVPWISVCYDINEVHQLQKDVDNGHQPGLIDPEQAAWDFVHSDLKVEKIVKSEVRAEKDGTKIVIITTGDERTLEVQLVQMAEKGLHGIWTVIRYRYICR